MKIVIEGAGEVGRHLAKMLCNEAHDVTVIDADNSRLAKLRSSADVITLLGASASIKTMKEAEVGDADLFISVNPGTNQHVNIVSAMIAKGLGAKKVTARIDNEEFLVPETKIMFKQMGIELMFYPEKLASQEIFALLKHSASTESMDFANGKLQLLVFKLEEDSPILEMELQEFAQKAASISDQFRVVAISTDGETIMPERDYKFKYHDLVFIMVKKESIPEIMSFIGKNNIEVNRIMILGGSKIAEITAQNLSKHCAEIKIIENDKAVCDQLYTTLGDYPNISIVHGDGRKSDVLLEENIRSYDAFIALTSSDEANVLACVVAKKFGVEKTIAEVETIEYLSLAEDMGIDNVINKKLITADRIFKFTLSGKARTVKKVKGTDAEVLEYTVAKNSLITKAMLKDLPFPKEAKIGGIIRGKDSFIAVGDTQIEAFDKVAVFALSNVVKDVDKFFK